MSRKRTSSMYGIKDNVITQPLHYDKSKNRTFHSLSDAAQFLGIDEIKDTSTTPRDWSIYFYKNSEEMVFVPSAGSANTLQFIQNRSDVYMFSGEERQLLQNKQIYTLSQSYTTTSLNECYRQKDSAMRAIDRSATHTPDNFLADQVDVLNPNAPILEKTIVIPNYFINKQAVKGNSNVLAAKNNESTSFYWNKQSRFDGVGVSDSTKEDLPEIFRTNNFGIKEFAKYGINDVKSWRCESLTIDDVDYDEPHKVLLNERVVAYKLLREGNTLTITPYYIKKLGWTKTDSDIFKPITGLNSYTTVDWTLNGSPYFTSPNNTKIGALRYNIDMSAELTSQDFWPGRSQVYSNLKDHVIIMECWDTTEYNDPLPLPTDQQLDEMYDKTGEFYIGGSGCSSVTPSVSSISGSHNYQTRWWDNMQKHFHSMPNKYIAIDLPENQPIFVWMIKIMSDTTISNPSHLFGRWTQDMYYCQPDGTLKHRISKIPLPLTVVPHQLTYSRYKGGIYLSTSLFNGDTSIFLTPEEFKQKYAMLVSTTSSGALSSTLHAVSISTEWADCTASYVLNLGDKSGEYSWTNECILRGIFRSIKALPMKITSIDLPPSICPDIYNFQKLSTKIKRITCAYPVWNGGAQFPTNNCFVPGYDNTKPAPVGHTKWKDGDSTSGESALPLSFVGAKYKNFSLINLVKKDNFGLISTCNVFENFNINLTDYDKLNSKMISLTSPIWTNNYGPTFWANVIFQNDRLSTTSQDAHWFTMVCSMWHYIYSDWLEGPRSIVKDDSIQVPYMGYITCDWRYWTHYRQMFYMSSLYYQNTQPIVIGALKDVVSCSSFLTNTSTSADLQNAKVEDYRQSPWLLYPEDHRPPAGVSFIIPTSTVS